MKKLFFLLTFTVSLFAQGSGNNTKSTLQTYFQTGDKPTQAQFYELISTFVSNYNAISEGAERIFVLDSALRIVNPAGTFFYYIKSSPISADRELKLPLITGTDTILVSNLVQSVTGQKNFSGVVNATGNLYIGSGSVYLDDNTNKMAGEATLVGGVAVVNNTRVTSTCLIMLTPQDSSGTFTGAPYVAGRSSGAWFRIRSDAGDTRKVAWQIYERGVAP